jgi:hypothetical protein
LALRARSSGRSVIDGTFGVADVGVMVPPVWLIC